MNGTKIWFEIEEFDTDFPVVLGAWEGYFADIAQDYLNSGKGKSGQVGQAQSYLFEAADLHDYAVPWLEEHFGTV